MMKKVYIVAKDWTMWESPQAINRQFDPSECHLVGWLVQEDKGKMIISLEWIPSPFGDEIRHVIAIPKENILRWAELKMEEWKK